MRQEAEMIHGDRLSREYIENELKSAEISLKVEVREEISSTSTGLRQYAEAGEVQDMLLLAEYQTGGRGRKGRSFYSPKGTGLYMSLLLHPGAPAGEVHMLTTLAAAAVAKALEKVSQKETRIKWVNDILVDGKKVVGILTETAGTLTDGCFDYVIVGIGINVYEPVGGFPEEIRDVAGAVFSGEDVQAAGSSVTTEPENESRIQKENAGIRDNCGSDQQNFRSRIAAETIKQFMEYYKVFPQKSYLEEYRSRSFLIGKEVRIIPTEQMLGSVAEAERATGREGNKDVIYATVLGIDEQCRLQVRYEDGREDFLSNGEVSVRER
ncbi:MAG: biotin--[Lachnospiraceae bacterium]|nr:biotin--[acetyl-CoA-carboxylase] ligase [Lachnospiraceae bacterium]